MYMYNLTVAFSLWGEVMYIYSNNGFLHVTQHAGQSQYI